jgi:type IV pilus assembly protein PilM
MLNTKSFLAVDFGAGSLKLAEFEENEAGGLRLKQFGIKALGLEGSQEATREVTILRALQDLFAERNFGSRNINVCAPGFHVFSKFVKLPPVDTSKVTQIIQYEAQQNVPFPLGEVVWDYQILGTSATGELEVLLVAIKSEIVEGLFRVAEGAGLRLQLVDVSPAALCNAFRYNYGDLEGCTMLLDIGAKTSNLLFFEKGKVYSRSINIGANAITQDFSNETKLGFPEAERLKMEEGFVSLGGAYEEPENPNQAAISKIARQVMTRLHIQVNQTIQFYRGQQGGSAPDRLFLSGGASIMPYTAQFFSEKLNLAVEYFNPFRNIQIDQNLDLEELAGVAHSFGEVVGLGLRNLAHCPVELNLMPKSSIHRQQFSQKKPYFIAAVFSLVLVIFALGWLYSRTVAIKQDALDAIAREVQPLRSSDNKLRRVKSDIEALRAEAEQVAGLAAAKTYWPEVLSELHGVLRRTETKAKQRLAQQGIDSEVGVWIESFGPGQAQIEATEEASLPRRDGMPPERGSRQDGMDETEAQPIMIECVCRGVDISPGANNDLAYTLYNELRNSRYFAAEAVQLGNIEADAGMTFSFKLSLKLNRSLNP